MTKKITKICLLFFMSFLTVSTFLLTKSTKSPRTDEAILAITKNDLKSFESYLMAGGKIEDSVMISDKEKTIYELILDFERINFLKIVEEKKLGEKMNERLMGSAWEIVISKNNPQLFEAMKRIYPKEKLKSRKVGQEGRTLLQLAGLKCSSNLVKVLEVEGMDRDERDSNGKSSLDLAHESGCDRLVRYWKKELTTQKIEKSLETVSAPIVSPKKVPDFYKKRSAPREILVKRSDLIETQVRPQDSYETAEYSEFSD